VYCVNGDLSDNVLSGTSDRSLENDVRLIGRHVVHTDEEHLRVAVWAHVGQ